jgi:hypothetical protein
MRPTKYILNPTKPVGAVREPPNDKPPCGNFTLSASGWPLTKPR